MADLFIQRVKLCKIDLAKGGCQCGNWCAGLGLVDMDPKNASSAFTVLCMAFLFYGLYQDPPKWGLVAESMCLGCMGLLLVRRRSNGTEDSPCSPSQGQQEERDHKNNFMKNGKTSSDMKNGKTSSDGKIPSVPTTSTRSRQTSNHIVADASASGCRRPKDDVNDEIEFIVHASASMLRWLDFDGGVRQCLHAIHQKHGRKGVHDALSKLVAHGVKLGGTDWKNSIHNSLRKILADPNVEL